MIFATHHYLAQIALSTHVENQKLAIKNIVLVSNDPISADIQQAFVRGHIIESLTAHNKMLITEGLQTHSNQVRYATEQHQVKSDDLPFISFEVKAITESEALPTCSKIFVDLSFIQSMTAVKFVDDSIRVTAKLKPSFNIVKDGEVIDRIFSKHIVNGSVSSITMGSGIKKVGLADFAKVQTQIGLLAKQEDCFSPIIWGAEDILECLYGESARSYACA